MGLELLQISHATSRDVRPMLMLGTPNLCSVCVKRWLFVVQFNGLGVELNSFRPVVRRKGFVAVILQGCSLLNSGSHDDA